MVSPLVESLSGEETVIQEWKLGYYPVGWKDLTKVASTWFLYRWIEVLLSEEHLYL